MTTPAASPNPEASLSSWGFKEIPVAQAGIDEVRVAYLKAEQMREDASAAVKRATTVPELKAAQALLEEAGRAFHQAEEWRDQMAVNVGKLSVIGSEANVASPILTSDLASIAVKTAKATTSEHLALVAAEMAATAARFPHEHESDIARAGGERAPLYREIKADAGYTASNS